MPYRKVCRGLRWLSIYSSNNEHFCRTKTWKMQTTKIYLATVSDNGDSLVQDESVFLWSLISREITNKPEKSLLTNEIIHSPRSDRKVSSELKSSPGCWVVAWLLGCCLNLCLFAFLATPFSSGWKAPWPDSAPEWSPFYQQEGRTNHFYQQGISSL